MAGIFGLTVTSPWLILSVRQTEIDPIDQLSQRSYSIHSLFLLIGALENILLVACIGRMSFQSLKHTQIEAIGIPSCIAILA